MSGRQRQGEQGVSEQLGVQDECSRVLKCFWKQRNKVVSVGSWTEKRKCEELDLNRNEWTQLPDTIHEHSLFPCLSIEYNSFIQSSNGVIVVVGSYVSRGFFGTIEYLDVRDRVNKWQESKDFNLQQLIFGEEIERERKGRIVKLF